MDEAWRPAPLERDDLVDSVDEPALDAITAVVARTLDVPIALIWFVDSERRWFESCVGLGRREARQMVAFGDHAIERRRTGRSAGRSPLNSRRSL